MRTSSIKVHDPNGCSILAGIIDRMERVEQINQLLEAQDCYGFYSFLVLPTKNLICSSNQPAKCGIKGCFELTPDIDSWV